MHRDPPDDGGGSHTRGRGSSAFPSGYPRDPVVDVRSACDSPTPEATQTESVMATSQEAGPESGDRRWYVVGRWQEYEGEGRTNLLRVVAIAAFYLVELANYHGVDLGIVH